MCCSRGKRKKEWRKEAVAILLLPMPCPGSLRLKINGVCVGDNFKSRVRKN